MIALPILYTPGCLCSYCVQVKCILGSLNLFVLRSEERQNKEEELADYFIQAINQLPTTDQSILKLFLLIILLIFPALLFFTTHPINQSISYLLQINQSISYLPGISLSINQVHASDQSINELSTPDHSIKRTLINQRVQMLIKDLINCLICLSLCTLFPS